MAVPVTVPRLGVDDGEALVAEWYQKDGAAVEQGDLVYRLENDFAAIDIEADESGVFRHSAAPGATLPFGEIVAYILGPGERLPGEKAPKTSDTASETPRKTKASRDRRAAYPLADVLAAGEAASEKAVPAPIPEGLPWDLFPAGDATPADDELEALKPVLLFPRIVNALKEESEQAATDLALIEEPPVAEPEPPTDGSQTGAWELVPGEADFNPAWLLEPSAREPETPRTGRGRFQASSIRNLALGRARAEKPASAADEPGAPATPDASAELASGGPAEVSLQAPPAPEADVPPPLAPELAAHEPLHEKDHERRAEHRAAAALFVRVTIDVTEAAKMRDQLTREWWGGNVRPTDEDIVLRAVARALSESAALRRRTDAVGLRPLSGSSRTVHLLPDAATRPFRDAVASLAALRETPGSDLPAVCTLTNYGELDLDEAMPALPGDQPLAFAMGAVRDHARFRAEQPYRASVLTLTLSYDPDAMPDGAAARLLARVRELVEAPYALLAE